MLISRIINCLFETSQAIPKHMNYEKFANKYDAICVKREMFANSFYKCYRVKLSSFNTSDGPATAAVNF